MAKRRKTGLGSSVTVHRKKAINYYDGAETRARVADAAAKQGRCLKALGSLKVAHEFFGEGNGHASALSVEKMPSFWGKARADAQDAIEDANATFRKHCVRR